MHDGNVFLAARRALGVVSTVVAQVSTETSKAKSFTEGEFLPFLARHFNEIWTFC